MPSPLVIGAAVAVLIVIVLVVVFSSGPKVPSAAELAAMDATAIAAIAPNVLKKIVAADLAALSETQKGALIEKQVAALTTAQVDALLLTFTPGQWGFLTQKQLNQLTETQMGFVTPATIKALTNTVLVAVAPKLSENQIDVLFTDSEFVSKIELVYSSSSKERVEGMTYDRLVSGDNTGNTGIAPWCVYLLLASKGADSVSWIHSSLIRDDLCSLILQDDQSSTFNASTQAALRVRCSEAGFNY